MQILAIAGHSFEGMADRMTEVEDCAQTCFGFVLAHDLRLNFTTMRNDFSQDFGIPLQESIEVAFKPPEKRSIIDDSILNHLCEARPIFSRRQCRESLQIAKH